MTNPFDFVDRNLNIGLKSILDSLKFIHAISLLTITPIFSEIQIQPQFISKILKEMSLIYARLINQNKFKYHTIFSARFNEVNEEDQRSGEIELYINWNIINNLTETDIDNIYVTSQLEHQIEIQETEELGWLFDKISSLKVSFY